MVRNFLRVILTLSVVVFSGCSAYKNSTISPQSVAPSVASFEKGGLSAAQSYALSSSSSFHQDSNGFRINSLKAPVNQTYYFSFDQAQMRPVDKKAIEVQGHFLSLHPRVKVTLFGNTDNRGSREYNIALGLRRDQSVASFLKKYGVSPNQVSMVSLGKENPAVLGNTEQAWALNRRVELKYKV